MGYLFAIEQPQNMNVILVATICLISLNFTAWGSPTDKKNHMKDFFESYNDRGYKEVEYFDDVIRNDDLYVVNKFKDDDNDNKFQLIRSLYYLQEDITEQMMFIWLQCAIVGVTKAENYVQKPKNGTIKCFDYHYNLDPTNSGDDSTLGRKKYYIEVNYILCTQESADWCKYQGSELAYGYKEIGLNSGRKYKFPNICTCK